MDFLIEFLKNLTNPDWLQAHGALYLVAFIIFAETGLFIGFFLPGDSLLFITGMMIASAKPENSAPFGSHPVNLVFWMFVLTLCAVLGNLVGYWFGRKSGPLLFERKETWIFKRKHLQNAHDFYEKRGGGAIIIARFLPIIRTFAPIVAGIVKMDFRKFFVFNVIGAVAWIASITFLGFILGENEWVKHNLEYIVIGLVLVTTLPVLFKMFFGKKGQKSA
ncbi:MAG: VTT domain-containing protein [Edaphocola sp.]